MSTIIQSLLGTAIAKFLPGFSYYSLLIQKAVDVSKTKIRCAKSVKERLNKRKLGVILTGQLKILSKDIMGSI